ncbi:hypothetical protein BDK51DRAFT_17825, partial [Blyttiomyces helicus]
IHLNTNAPFCLVAVGVQGAGKSHTVATVIENCTLNSPPVSVAAIPCSTLVFHFDTDEANCSQAAMLTSPNAARARNPDRPNCEVLPLLFSWREMTAGGIKTLMGATSAKTTPLYMGAMLSLLRKLQKEDNFPTFAEFKDQIEELNLSSGQKAPLRQRLALIESFLNDSAENAGLPTRTDLADVCKSGTVVVCDLTDPMLSAAEARGVFEIVLQRFKALQLGCGKLLVLDEAHKFLTHSTASDELGATIVELVRQMRHHGMRVVVSSQSPLTIPDELLELASICVMHSFYSKDWFKRLKRKMPLEDAAFERIMKLPTGNAVVFATRWKDFGSGAMMLGRGVRELRIRERLTEDGGKSKIIR